MLAVAGSTLRYWQAGATPGAALAISTACVALAIAALSTSSLGVQFQPPQVPRLMKVLFIALVTGPAAVLFVPAVADRVMHRPGVPILAALWITAAGCTALGAWLLSRLVYWGTSADAETQVNPRSSLELAARYREGWAFAGHKCEAQIDSWLERTNEDWTWWRRVTRWRCGNPPLRMIRMAPVHDHDDGGHANPDAVEHA